MRGPWEFEEPRCAEIGGDLFFPEKNEDTAELKLAKKICNSCTHKVECLEWAIAAPERHGIWGGLNPRTRQRIRAMRKKKSA